MCCFESSRVKHSDFFLIVAIYKKKLPIFNTSQAFPALSTK